MPSRAFTIDELNELEVSYANELKVGNGARRWSENFDVVFRAEDDGKLYFVSVEEGLTENQDYYGSERFPDYEYVANGDDYVVCPEVELYEEMVPVKKWRMVS